ncbi:MAG: AraC family transcriptional regulator [Bacteroidota bacterium]
MAKVEKAYSPLIQLLATSPFYYTNFTVLFQDMRMEEKYFICSNLPGFENTNFGMGAEAMAKYYHLSQKKNVLTHLVNKGLSNPTHPGQLSVKCAFGRGLAFHVNGKNLAPDNCNYLLLNSGTCYSSHIETDENLELFSIFFSEQFEKENFNGILASHDTNLTDPFNFGDRKIFLLEKLYAHDEIVTPVIMQLKSYSMQFHSSLLQIDELYYLLIERLYMREIETLKEIENVNAIRSVTRLELYKRLSMVKDFIDSSFNENIGLEDMAAVALMNNCYLLRQFKKYYKITPGQYLIKKRMLDAKRRLDDRKDLSISDVCMKVGYDDVSSFSKLFKKHFSYSPENYLKKKNES